MTIKKAHINTIGCQMNVYDSGRMSEILKSENYQMTGSYADADLIIVNTCAIREKAVQKVYSFLGRLRTLKKRNKKLTVAVAGCVAQQEGQKLIDRFPLVDIIMGTHTVHQLAEILRSFQKNRQPLILTDMSEKIIEINTTEKVNKKPAEVSSFVTIMRGCDNYCSYCVVPYVRGKEVSRQPRSIIAEIERLVESGVKEITLLGQNVNSYGVKEGLTSFPDLLAMVNNVNGLERIRFVTSHPKDLSDSLIESFGTLSKLCNHIHLPVQSGSNRILKKMNRKYTREEYLEKIAKLRTISPDIAITTDFIVGFPGETENEFNETLELIKTVKFDSLFAFAYSDRPEAPARKFKQKIDDIVKNQRLRSLLNLHEEISKQTQASLVGKVFSVLVEGSSKNQIKKIRSSSAHELSGRTSENRIVNFDCPLDLISEVSQLKGQILNVKIEKVYSNSLKGIVIDNQKEFLKIERGHSHVA
jgi:tRNA-2-methylthio-N6-dimethylallyladenosine synthase